MSPLQYKLLGAMAAIFIAGAVTGSVWNQTKSERQQQSTPCYTELSDMLTQRLASQLALSEDQLQKISPEICRTCSELTNIHHQTLAAGRESLEACYRKIEPFLTEQQKLKLNACEAQQNLQLLTIQKAARSRDLDH